MGRREAWSADRTGDTRTKPTHWEFQQQTRGDDHEEKLDQPRMRMDEKKQQTSHFEMEDETVMDEKKQSTRANKTK